MFDGHDWGRVRCLQWSSYADSAEMYVKVVGDSAANCLVQVCYSAYSDSGTVTVVDNNYSTITPGSGNSARWAGSNGDYKSAYVDTVNSTYVSVVT